MIPVHCMVRHDPDAGTVGDCVRACVASIMELPYDAVPHFYEGDCDGIEGERRVKAWLRTQNASLFRCAYGSIGFEQLMEHMSQFPDLHYMLSGELIGNCGCHMVVCKGDKIVHDPAWYSVRFAGPPVENGGYWLVDVIVKA